jgi:hypothetical protein
VLSVTGRQLMREGKDPHLHLNRPLR